MSASNTLTLAIVWAAWIAALFYAGGFNFLFVSAYNLVNKGYPVQANHTLWSTTLPFSTHVLHKLDDELLQALPADSTGVKEIGGLPFFAEALPMFIVSLLLEVVLTILRGKPWYNYKDTVSSLSAGLLNQTAGSILRYVVLFPYAYIYENYRLADLSDNRLLMWVVAFVGIDFAYYWFHRMAHEVNWLWALHDIHHSSEDYNLSTALRQTAFNGFDGFIFYLPLAPFVPPSVANTHKMFNLLYQFWIHTRHIPKLPFPIEYVLNTPSHHRVHHGRNPWCVDCNYGGTLIIWDRLFGTFHEERDDDSICYGIIPPLKSWDPWHAQLIHHKEILRRMRNTPLAETPKNLVVGPGRIWVTPKKKVDSKGNPLKPRWKDLPVAEIGNKFNPVKTPMIPMPTVLYIYTGLGMVFVTGVFFAFSSGPPVASRPMIETVLTAAYVGSAVWTIGLIHDRLPITAVLEPLRALLAAAGTAFLLFCSGPLPTSLDSLAACYTTAAGAFTTASPLFKVAVIAHVAQAALALAILPFAVAESEEEVSVRTRIMDDYKLENAEVFEQRKLGNMVISRDEIAAGSKKDN